jgi:hypothetical protein
VGAKEEHMKCVNCDAYMCVYTYIAVIINKLHYKVYCRVNIKFIDTLQNRSYVKCVELSYTADCVHVISAVPG